MTKIELKKGKRLNVRIDSHDRHIVAGCPVRVIGFNSAFVEAKDQDGEMRTFRRADFIFEEVT